MEIGWIEMMMDGDMGQCNYIRRIYVDERSYRQHFCLERVLGVAAHTAPNDPTLSGSGLNKDRSVYPCEHLSFGK